MAITELSKRDAATRPSRDAAGAEERADAPLRGRPFVFRSQFLVDTSAQLRASLSTMLIVAGLLAMLNVALYQMGELSTAAIGDFAPELLPELEKADRSRTAITIACSIVFLLGFGALRVVESHRIYGAAFNIVRQLRGLGEGRFDVSVRLRKDDRLHRLADAVNGAARSLRERERDEAGVLSGFAARAREIDSVDDARRLAAEIDELVEAKRRSAR